MIPDKSLSINQGAITAMGWQSCTDKTSFSGAILNALAKRIRFQSGYPRLKIIRRRSMIFLIYGTGGKVVKVYYRGQRGEGIYDIAFEGLIQSMNRKYRETFSDSMKAEYETFMRITPCPACKGQRLKKESLAVTVGGKKYFRGDRYVDRQIPRIYRCAGADADAAGDWCADFERDSGEDQLPYQCRSGIPFPCRVRLARCPAARRSESAWQPRSAPVWSVWHIFWTSRVSDFTSGTTTSFWIP